MSDIPSVEMQILSSWEDWDLIDTGHFAFNEAVLRVPVGTHPRGSRFSQITFDFEHSQMRIYASETDENPETYALHLQVGPRIE